MTTESYDLTQLFTKPLLSKHGIVILGATNTTGYGKTQFALRLAVEWAKAYNQVMQLPQEDAVVVFSNTLDVAKEVKFKPGYVWVIDEVNPSDPTQAIHMSDNMMKVLLAPTAPGSIRCRNADLSLPPGVPRIFTGNAETVQEWCGHRVKWSEPIQRKSVVFMIKSPLVPDSWRNENALADDDEPNDAAAVARELREGVGRIFPDAPPEAPSLVGRMLSVVQRMFGAGSSSSSSLRA